jgi:hypothetical protein
MAIKYKNNMDTKINNIEKVNLQSFEDLTNLENCISTLPANKELLASLFSLLERHPNFNFGEPGRIIHFMERYENKIYAPLLFDSLKRKPTKYTIWMLNRYLNSIPEEEQKKGIDMLKEIAAQNHNPEIVDEANFFLQDYL